MPKVQPAAGITWCNRTEHKLTSDVEVDLVLCGLNLATLIPAALTTSLTRVKYFCSDHTWVGPAQYEVNVIWTDFTPGLVFQ